MKNRNNLLFIHVQIQEGRGGGAHDEIVANLRGALLYKVYKPLF
jgi:hypothetical protein